MAAKGQLDGSCPGTADTAGKAGTAAKVGGIGGGQSTGRRSVTAASGKAGTACKSCTAGKAGGDGVLDNQQAYHQAQLQHAQQAQRAKQVQQPKQPAMAVDQQPDHQKAHPSRTREFGMLSDYQVCPRRSRTSGSPLTFYRI